MTSRRVNMKPDGAARTNPKPLLGLLLAAAVGCLACLVPMLLAGSVLGSVAGFLGGRFGWLIGLAILVAGVSSLLLLRRRRLNPGASCDTSGECSDSGCGC